MIILHEIGSIDVNAIEGGSSGEKEKRLELVEKISCSSFESNV
jgi:hypothetical protein